MKGLLTRLKRKYGPLPLWAWSAIAGGGGFLYMRSHRGDTADATSSSSTEPDSFPVAGDVGDLPGGSSGGNGAGGAPGTDSGLNADGSLELGDRNVASAVGDFVDQLLAQEQQRVDEALAQSDNGATAETTNPRTDEPSSAFPTKPAPKGKSKPGRKRTKGKKTARPRPRITAKPTSRTNRGGRGAPKHGKGAAGARARGRARPKPKPARPRGPVGRVMRKPPKPKRPALRRRGGRPR